MVLHDSNSSRSAAAYESSTIRGVWGDGDAIDQPIDRLPPAAGVMAELGADVAIIADALSARPDWTPEQVRDLWAWCRDRIARSGGQLTEGIFFHALRGGQLAPPRAGAVDWAAYAHAAEPPPDAGPSPHERARAILPDWSGPRDYPLLVQLLGAGLSDAAALAELARKRGRAA